jgi:hypothetical protein
MPGLGECFIAISPSYRRTQNDPSSLPARPGRPTKRDPRDIDWMKIDAVSCALSICELGHGLPPHAIRVFDALRRQ